jgi:hypothetical protein
MQFSTQQAKRHPGVLSFFFKADLPVNVILHLQILADILSLAIKRSSSFMAVGIQT